MAGRCDPRPRVSPSGNSEGWSASARRRPVYPQPPILPHIPTRRALERNIPFRPSPCAGRRKRDAAATLISCRRKLGAGIEATSPPRPTLGMPARCHPLRKCLRPTEPLRVASGLVLGTRQAARLMGPAGWRQRAIVQGIRQSRPRIASHRRLPVSRPDQAKTRGKTSPEAASPRPTIAPRKANPPQPPRERILLHEVRGAAEAAGERPLPRKGDSRGQGSLRIRRPITADPKRKTPPGGGV